MKNHENRPITMKNQPGTMKNHVKPTWNHENPPRTMKNQPKAMKTDMDPLKTRLFNDFRIFVFLALLFRIYGTLPTKGSNCFDPKTSRHGQEDPTDFL